jgi:hypothetical protein
LRCNVLILAAQSLAYRRGGDNVAGCWLRVGVIAELRGADFIVSVCDAIGLETSLDHTPTRVFWERRLQVDENKGREVEKEDKEAANLRKAKMAR